MKKNKIKSNWPILDANMLPADFPFPTSVADNNTIDFWQKKFDNDIKKHMLEGNGAEVDPNGVDLNSPGAKADAGKNRVWLMLAGFSRAIEEVSKVTTIGANKYTPNGWVDVSDGKARYMDAFGRHMLKLGAGEIFDNGKGGTGCYHKAQMIWNLLAAFELELRENESA